MTAGREQSDADAAFYFDLGSPLAYLAAERVLHALPVAAAWQPVLAGADIDIPAVEKATVERAASDQGLQPLRWPKDYPFNSEQAMLVATYAKSIGRAVPFAQAAFRQAFAGGRSLAELDNILIAAAACEMHPRAVIKGAKLTSTKAQLVRATADAADAGITAVPAVRIGEQVFVGEHAIAEVMAA